MNWSNNLYVRWAATAGIVVLMIVIGVRWAARERPADDAAALLGSAPAAGDALLEPLSEAAAMPASATTEPAAGATAVELIAVDVVGAVTAPGVYRLQPAARVDDAVAAAGGLAPDANRERINLAATLEDGAQIRVPRADEGVETAVPEAQAASPANTAAGARVDINTADAATLEELPGIGPATAQAIVAYREANGPFGAVDDLQNVKGIGPSLFGKIVELVMAGN